MIFNLTTQVFFYICNIENPIKRERERKFNVFLISFSHRMLNLILQQQQQLNYVSSFVIFFSLIT